MAVALPAYPYASSGSYLTNFPGPVQYGPEARNNLQGVVGTATSATQSLATWQLKQLRRKWVFIICLMDASCPSIAFPDKHPWAPATAIRSYPNQFRIDHLDEEPIRSYPNQFRIDDMDEELFRPYPIQFRIDDLDEEPIRPYYPLQFRINDLAEVMQHREMSTPNHLSANQMLTPNQFVANEMSTPNHLGTNQMFTPNRLVADESTPNHLGANQMLTPNHLVANQMTPNRLVADEMSPNRFVASQMTPNRLVADETSTPNRLVANQISTPNQLVANQMQTQNQLAANQMLRPNQLVANQMFTPNRLIPDDGKDSVLTNAMTAPTNIRGVNKATSKLVGLAEFQMAQWVWKWNIILCFVNPSCPHVNIPSPTTRFGRQYPPIRVDVEKMRMMAETQQQPRVMFPVSFVRD